MDLLDANILIGAFRADDPGHKRIKPWLEETLQKGIGVTFPALVEVAFLRIVTHPKIFKAPSSREQALAFLDAIASTGLFREARWTPRARERWRVWCRQLDLSGDDVNDAFLAATAAEGGYRLVSCDRGFSRFKGLAWWNPSESEADAR